MKYSDLLSENNNNFSAFFTNNLFLARLRSSYEIQLRINMDEWENSVAFEVPNAKFDSSLFMGSISHSSKCDLTCLCVCVKFIVGKCKTI